MSSRVEIVRWIAENGRPSPSTVSRDVRVVFARSRQRIAAMQKHNGLLHFATDAWTSPNHRAYILVTVHFEHKGEAICLILDVNVSESHTGINLAIAFAEILKEFGIYYNRS